MLLRNFLLRYTEYAIFLTGKEFLDLGASEVVPKFGVCGDLIIVCEVPPKKCLNVLITHSHCNNQTVSTDAVSR